MGTNYSREIKRYRDRYNLTQKEFAEKLKVGLATVIRWEQGQFQPTLKVRDKLDKVLFDKEEKEEVIKPYPYRCREGMYDTVIGQLESLIRYFSFDKQFLAKYFEVTVEDLDKLTSSFDEDIDVESEVYKKIETKIPYLYFMTLKQNDAVLMYSLIKDMKDYNLTSETIAKSCDIDEKYIAKLLNKDGDILPAEVKYRISIFLLNLEQAINKQ